VTRRVLVASVVSTQTINLGEVRARQPPQRAKIAPVSQQIQFVGTLSDGAGWDTRSFSVLAGEGGPTVTGGFAKWNVIDRPQRVGMTVLGGYDPISIDIPVRFDNVVQTSDQVRPIEDMISDLEWMGGRGPTFKRVGAPGQGDSPLIQIFTVDNRGNQTLLIPAQYQTPDLYWVIKDIQYDASPLRNEAGHRLRQDVTISLLQHVGSPFSTSYDSSTVRARGRAGQTGFREFAVTRQHNTIRKIATFDAHNTSHAAAVEILDANRDRLHLSRSVDEDLLTHHALGTKIRVPAKLIGGGN
jgi:hypothetical protein